MAKIKNFFKKIGRWLKNHAPSKRRLIQVYAALLFNANVKGFITGKIYSGPLKNLCSPGLNCYSCPGASLACPLGALQDSLAQSDTRAPFYILGILALLGLTLARTICGFLCPVGLGQELLHKIKTPKVKKSRYTRIFSYFKYVLLAVTVIAIPLIYHGIPAFCKYICPAGTLGGAVGLLSNPNNADFFSMLGYLFSWKFILLVVFIVACVFIYRFFCRFFCPLGAIYGFFNKIALLGVKLEEDKCVECGLCLQTCQMDIRKVGDHECINCGACIPVCPTKAISWKGSKIFLKATDAAIAETPSAQSPQGGIAALLERGAAEIEAEDTAPVSVFPEAAEGEPLPELLSQSREKAEQSLQNGGICSDEEVAVADTGVSACGAYKNAVCAERNEGENRAATAAERNEGENRAEAVSHPAVAKEKKRNFRLQLAAWAVALVVLLGAILYYNFFTDTVGVTVYGVGDHCPDFVLNTYDSAGAYDDAGNRRETVSSLECKGTVTVVNFWYVTCDPCVEELPYFESVRSEFGDDVVMIAVHAPDMYPADQIQGFIDGEYSELNGKYWSEFGIVFAQDTAELNAFVMLGGKGAYPVTVIVDRDGNIAYINQGKVETEALRGQISSLLGD